MAVSHQQIEQVRAFNRDYTRRIGVLSQRLLDSRWSLSEARVLYEIAHRPGVTASELAADLGLDRGYLSRILKRFAARKLIARAASGTDARRLHLRLTPAGRDELMPLEQRARRQVRTLLSPLDAARREALLLAMSAIRGAFDPPAAADGLVLRTHRPGDMGWVVERHGALYACEYGWNEEFEGLVAGITADFIRRLDPARERCWIAELHGRRVGCIFLVAGQRGSARLRLLLVEPEARGLGLGGRLVRECISFARAAGYQRIVLWTQSILLAARRLYQRAGFVRIARKPHHGFGHDLIGETWELSLAPAARSAVRRAPRAVKPQ
jgi:DNA-binding MarR family transcriptional regulator/predicted N-acetyltransferase YhbS